MELRIRRADCEVIHAFLTAWRVGAPHPCVAQGSTVFRKGLIIKVWQGLKKLQGMVQETRVNNSGAVATLG